VKLELVLVFIRNGILYKLGLDNTKYKPIQPRPAVEAVTSLRHYSISTHYVT